MNVINDKEFLNEATEITTSDVLGNPNSGDALILEVYGDAVGFTMEIEGKVKSDEWTTLGYYDSLANYGSSITSNGIYNIPIQGILNIRANLSSITSGSISAFGRIGG